MTSHLRDGSVHHAVAYRACLRAYGCQWVHADGRVEPVLEGESPELRPPPTPPPGM